MNELYFKVEKDYDRTRFDEMIRLGGYEIWDRELKRYVWFFPMKEMKRVEALLTTPLEIEGFDYKTEKMNIEGWKGKSGFDIIEFPKIFQLVEYRKSKTTGKVNSIKHSVSKETVLQVWEVLKDYPQTKMLKFETLSEAICKSFGLMRFFRQTGTYDKQKFFGSRAEAYFPFYYYPLKVLEYKGVIQYTSKYTRRINDELEFQTEFKEVIYESGDVK